MPAKLNSPSARLFLASFLLLFAEVMVIRWLSAELAIIRAMPNLVLMIVFIGASSGLSNPDKSKISKWWMILALIGLLVPLVFATPWGFENLSVRFGHGVPIWQTLASVLTLLDLAVSLLVLFSAVGAALGREFNQLPPLQAYAVNLAGSILGVIAFGLAGWLQTCPAIWLAACGLCVCLITRNKVAMALSCGAVVLSLAVGSTSIWSPYSKLDIVPLDFPADSPLGKGNFSIEANNGYLQSAINVAPAENGYAIPNVSDPRMAHDIDWARHGYRWLPIPYKYAGKYDDVLILGTGCGEDVSYALHAGAKHVDAVEIDPLIASFGKTAHPNKPYSDPRVTLHNEDARTFLRYNQHKYDLVLFAYLDFARAYNSASFLRSDNFIHTVECYKSALNAVKPDGMVIMSFATGYTSPVTSRIYQTITQANGKPPYVIADNTDSVYFFGPAAYAKPFENLVKNGFEVWPKAGQNVPTRTSTDDWPFLYLTMDPPGVELYVFILFLTVLLPGILLTKVQSTKSSIGGGEWGNMLFLGQAFMLIETTSITRLSLLFGATWIVSSVVILTILILAFCANLAVSKMKNPPLNLFYALLAGTLLLSYFWHVPEQANLPPLATSILSSFIVCLPILFAGMVFSSCFKRARQPAQYLAANLLGTTFGGLTENLSLCMGLKALSLVALGLYAASFICLKWRPYSESSEDVAPAPAAGPASAPQT